FLHRHAPFAAHRPPPAISKLPHIEIQLGDGPAEGIAMHTQLPCCLALVAPICIKDVHDEAFFEFAYRFRIEDATGVHLNDECFELLFHGFLAFTNPKAGQGVYLCGLAALLLEASCRRIRMPSLNFWRTAEGAAQTAARPATKKYPA